MKKTKLILGIITIVLSCVVLFQSCAAGAVNSLSENGESSGSAGAIVALLMLSGAITMIVSHKSTAKGGSIAGIIIFGIAALLGFSNAGSVFKDLIVWASFCVILVIINIIAICCRKKSNEDQEKKE